jgi:hypothetical protein
LFLHCERHIIVHEPFLFPVGATHNCRSLGLAVIQRTVDVIVLKSTKKEEILSASVCKAARTAIPEEKLKESKRKGSVIVISLPTQTMVQEYVKSVYTLAPCTFAIFFSRVDHASSRPE